MSFLLYKAYKKWQPNFCLNYLITNSKSVQNIVVDLDQKRMYFNDAKIIGKSDSWNKGNRGAYFAFGHSLYKGETRDYFLRTNLHL